MLACILLVLVVLVVITWWLLCLENRVQEPKQIIALKAGADPAQVRVRL